MGVRRHVVAGMGVRRRVGRVRRHVVAGMGVGRGGRGEAHHVKVVIA
jgi:hypothetical protein